MLVEMLIQECTNINLFLLMFDCEYFLPDLFAVCVLLFFFLLFDVVGEGIKWPILSLLVFLNINMLFFVCSLCYMS